ncbi:MAG: ATP-binding protein [Candidatus Muirbacterium halophilum]|nr:ATP-binding protein [Candidatus Muirbacterium halophilum]MCK9475076.1 ATP-binding protein [Candidatus Muirbacterium halophilum]
MDRKYIIEGGNFSEAGFASSDVKKLLKKLGLPTNIIKKVAIAMYEAEINVVAHAYRGEMEFKIVPGQIRVTVQDEGPGIPDVELAFTEGFSTASSKVREMGFGAGMGLPNIKRNTDEISLHTEVEKGTKLSFIINFT